MPQSYAFEFCGRRDGRGGWQAGGAKKSVGEVITSFLKARGTLSSVVTLSSVQKWRVDPKRAVGRDIDREPGFAQPFRDAFADRLVIFHNQDTHVRCLKG